MHEGYSSHVCVCGGGVWVGVCVCMSKKLKVKFGLSTIVSGTDYMYVTTSVVLIIGVMNIFSCRERYIGRSSQNRENRKAHHIQFRRQLLLIPRVQINTY